MTTLGPTFVKLGQILSTRPDVLPPEYVEVLSELQDRVPPAAFAEARPVVESELGPIEEAFDEFDSEAISGASLGQVYRAEVEGESVAIKVRRPGIEALVEADLRVIRWSLPFVRRFVGESRAFSLSNLATEFAQTIREEMDYEREAAMLTEIRQNFSEEPEIAIPRVIDSHSTERVLTMSYVAGTKITAVDALEAEGIDRTAIAERLQRAYLKMIIEDGVYHADPHPGNLAVQPDGTVVFYDFGMSARVDSALQSHIVDFYIAVANQDIDGILDSLVAMGTLSPSANRSTMADVMELAIRDMRGEVVEQHRVQQIIGRIENTMYEFPLRLPSNLALVLRVATVVEGVAVTLDPEFDFISVATEYLGEEGYREESARQYLEETGEQLTRSTRAALRTPPKLERMLDRFDRDDFYVRADIEDSSKLLDTLALRLVYALFVSVGWLSVALLYAFTQVRAAAVAAVLTLGILVLLIRTFRSKTVSAQPQFTRQNLDERSSRDRSE